MPVILAEVRGAPVEPNELLALVSRSDAGAVVQFTGVVRDHDSQATGKVVALVYTCHPAAPDMIGQIIDSVLSQSDPDNECLVAAVHRTGHLDVGDYAFLVAVSAPHRRLAFDVCDQIVEQVKACLPMWKQQFQTDGTYSWSGL